MESLIKGVGIAVVAILVIGLVAVFSGTIVYWIWPHVVPDVFPGLVAAGYVVAKLAWFKAVLLTWLCGILIKGSSTSSSK